MAHILAIELSRRTFESSVIADKPGAEPENVATVYVDWSANWWHVRTRKDEFLNLFHATQGAVTTTNTLLYGDGDQSLAQPSGDELIILKNYGLNPQSKLSGRAMFGKGSKAKQVGTGGGVANEFEYYTFFWRKLRGQDMTPRERVEEMFAIATSEYSQQIAGDVVQQIRGLADAESLFKMGAVLLTFAVASAAVGLSWFVGALSVLCGAADLATNWEMYQPYWNRFTAQVATGNDLNYGAQALATLLGGLLGWGATNVVGAKISKMAAPKMQHLGNKFADAVHNNSPARWKQAAQRGQEELKQKAAESGDPNNTKIDPAKSLTPEERQTISNNKPKLLQAVREMAKAFGYPPNIAEGYAMMAFRNGWTIIARTSKKASIPHHLLGEENVTGKSLYVQYKIDSQYGVIFGDPPRNIEADFYSKESYAAKQIEAIYYAENPGAPKGSFKITDEVMRSFRNQHIFEFRTAQVGGKMMKNVLFHNGRMVIGDVDLMGIYVRRGHDLVPLPQWMIHNDAAFLQAFINRNVDGVPTSFHGQQDVGRNYKTDKPFRSPDADEDYAVFSPDMTLRKVNSTSQLERLYRGVHILWPYATYLSVRSSVTHFVISATRRQPAPSR